MTHFKPTNTMLQNYIQDKLSPQETEQLELWLADHPEVMDDLELDLMFKQADYNPSTETVKVKAPSFQWLDIFTGRKWLPVHLLAYGLVAFFMINALTHRETSVYADVINIEVDTTRGHNDVYQAKIAINSQLRPLKIDFYYADLSNKHANTLINFPNGKSVEASVKFSNYGEASLLIKPEFLSEGLLKVEMVSKDDNSLVKHMEFELIKME
jgi:hypothetical protein